MHMDNRILSADTARRKQQNLLDQAGRCRAAAACHNHYSTLISRCSQAEQQAIGHYRVVLYVDR